ncbi:10861_t:CDS:2, partial [Acaulospora colombiana]
ISPSSSHEAANELYFTEEAADFLREQLKVISLPDLSSIEQAQLLALIDTIIEVESQKRSLDENGVRYVFFMRRFHQLNRITLSTVRTPGLNYRDMNWALHSDSQDLLIEYSMAASGGKFLWKDARVHGIFLWIRNNETVRQQMEILARNQYMLKDYSDEILKR